MVNPPLDPGDLAACRETLRNGSRTFLAASLLLPRSVRDPACALYAFCRLADDVVDEGDGSQTTAQAVAQLRKRLQSAYRGTPQAVAADRALSAVVARHDVPAALPGALLDGFDWDAAGRRYETLDDVCDYAARVAGSVGAMMALLMGVRSADVMARACELGVAMQLSNIARDVGQDARMGRLYLPAQWLREAGIDADAWLANPVFSPALASVVQRLLDTADELYRRADAGIACLPRSCRPGISASRRLYADIGHEVARRGFDSVSQRAVVAAPRKAGILLLSVSKAMFRAPTREPMPVLPAIRFLVEAVDWPARSHKLDTAVAPSSSWGWRPLLAGCRAIGERWSSRALWLIELFERLERRDQLRAPRG